MVKNYFQNSFKCTDILLSGVMLCMGTSPLLGHSVKFLQKCPTFSNDLTTPKQLYLGSYYYIRFSTTNIVTYLILSAQFRKRGLHAVSNLIFLYSELQYLIQRNTIRHRAMKCDIWSISLLVWQFVAILFVIMNSNYWRIHLHSVIVQC